LEEKAPGVYCETHQPHPDSPLDHSPALKVQEQYSRTPAGKALRSLTLGNGYSNVFVCVDLGRKFSSGCVCMDACLCVVGIFQKPYHTKYKQYRLFIIEV